MFTKMSITPDILYEILRKIDHLDISRWCRSSPEFANFCRSDRGQALIRQKQQTYREERVEDFLDSLSSYEIADDLIWKLNRTSRLEQDSEKEPSIPEQFFERYIQLMRKAKDEFYQRHPDLKSNIGPPAPGHLFISFVPTRLHTEEELLELDNINYDVLKQLLLEYYDLLPTVKRNFEENKYGTGSIGVYGGEAR